MNLLNRENSRRKGIFTRACMRAGTQCLMRRFCLDCKSEMASNQDQRLEFIIVKV